jgi:hypothetical protein
MTQGFWSQMADKAAGPQIARLSLFLALYGASACLSHAMTQSSFSKQKQENIESLVGALMIIAGCVPFAMSNVQKAKPGDVPSASQIEEV